MITVTLNLFYIAQKNFTVQHFHGLFILCSDVISHLNK